MLHAHESQILSLIFVFKSVKEIYVRIVEIDIFIFHVRINRFPSTLITRNNNLHGLKHE